MIGRPETIPTRQRSHYALGLAALVSVGSMTAPARAASEPKVAKPAPATSQLPTATTPVTQVPAPPTPPVPTPAQLAQEALAQQRKLAIDTARARCTALLKTITAVTVAQDPIEDGACGSLAPVELVSVGKNPAVTLSPPAVVNCDMVVALYDWVKSDIQPLAKKHLGKPIIRINTMSSYSCRNVFGRKMARLSEHGKANALDIGGFATTSGQMTSVLADWGLTSGEIQIAAARAEKERLAREFAAKAEADARAKALAANKPSSGTPQSPNPVAAAGSVVEGLAKSGITVNGQTLDQRGPTGFGLTQPSRLGGPKKPADTAAPSAKAAAPQANAPATVATDPNAATGTSLFMRAVHEAACKRFTTTLGPEADAAHRNHFHVDLAERKSKPICD